MFRYSSPAIRVWADSHRCGRFTARSEYLTKQCYSSSSTHKAKPESQASSPETFSGILSASMLSSGIAARLLDHNKSS